MATKTLKELSKNLELFKDVKVNEGLISQVYKALKSNKRNAIADTKTRGEVSGGGRKPWKQKGTGRARQGSIRSPQWIGGGIVFGPNKKKNYRKIINKKIKKQVLRQLLSVFQKDEKLIIVDEIPNLIKTKQAALWLAGLAIKEGRITLISNKEKADLKAFSNLGYLNIQYIKGVQADIIIESDWIVLPKIILDEVVK